MNNFIFICEDDFKEIILQAVILAVMLGNNRKDDNNGLGDFPPDICPFQGSSLGDCSVCERRCFSVKGDKMHG